MLAEYEVRRDGLRGGHGVRPSLRCTTLDVRSLLSVSASFDGCRNHASIRLVRMAESWGGTVSAHDAADLLIGLGLSESTRDNLVATLQKEMMADRAGSVAVRCALRTYCYLPHRRTRDGATGVAEEQP